VRSLAQCCPAGGGEVACDGTWSSASWRGSEEQRVMGCESRESVLFFDSSPWVMKIRAAVTWAWRRSWGTEAGAVGMGRSGGPVATDPMRAW
jgi:hypothetical protein